MWICLEGAEFRHNTVDGSIYTPMVVAVLAKQDSVIRADESGGEIYTHMHTHICKVVIININFKFSHMLE